MAIDLTGKQSIKFDIYSSRTGNNFKIGVHDSGGTTSEVTTGPATANNWETITWDISAVSDANKDAIDSIIVTIVNADAANTFYIDNMYAPPMAYQKEFDEVLTASDLGILRAVTRPFSDTSTLSDIYARGAWNPARTLTETLTFSEVVGKAISILLEETVTLSEVYAKVWTIARTYTDTTTLSDIFTKALKWLKETKTASSWSALTKAASTWVAKTRDSIDWTKKYG